MSFSTSSRWPKRLAILFICMSILFASYFAGSYVAVPLIKILGTHMKVQSLLGGAIITGIVFLIYRSFVIARYNKQQERIALQRIPRNFRQVKNLGIQNTVDYCTAMQFLFAYKAIPNLGLPSPFMRESNNMEAWEASTKLFKCLYGRDPHGIDQGEYNWGYLAACEAKEILHKDSLDSLDSAEIVELLSPEIRENLGIESV